MAQQIPNEFLSFDLSVQEVLEGSILNSVQIQSIQNERAIIAQQILGLVFDPQNMFEFCKQDAYLKGQLAVYTNLLERSDAARQELQALAVATARSQSNS